MIESYFKIFDPERGYVQMITAIGEVVHSNLGCTFSNYGEAHTYLINAQRLSRNAQVYIDISRFMIQEMRLMPYSTIPVQSSEISEILYSPDSEESIKWFKAILHQAVRDGFKIIDPRILEFSLTYDKYQPIMSQIVPPHMLQSIDEFMSVGIKECDLNDLGSISLTATEEQLTMFDIEKLIFNREHKISK